MPAVQQRTSVPLAAQPAAYGTAWGDMANAPHPMHRELLRRVSDWSEPAEPAVTKWSRPARAALILFGAVASWGVVGIVASLAVSALR